MAPLYANLFTMSIIILAKAIYELSQAAFFISEKKLFFGAKTHF